MDRTVNTHILNNWLEAHAPQGLALLAVKSGVSHWTLQKVKLGDPPRKAITRKLICEAMGISEDTLFPVLDQAS